MKIDNYKLINKEMLNKKIIAFPTDTIFGVAGIIDDIDAINKIYQIKKRDQDKPLAILAASINDILPYVEIENDNVIKIMEKYWPGALTIIFKKSSKVNDLVTRGKNTVAFRIPNNTVALEILKQTGPLATTSVNISGEAPLNTYEEILDVFKDKIDYVVGINMKSSSVASTIIDCTSNDIKVLRQGQIKIEKC